MSRFTMTWLSQTAVLYFYPLFFGPYADFSVCDTSKYIEVPFISENPSTFRKISDIVRSQSPPTSPSPIPGSPTWCLWLVSALQGYEINSEDRRKLVDDIEQMSYDGQETLIEFLETGVAPSTLENNACKQFVCNTTELPTVLASKDPQELLVLWQQLYHQTLPALQSILYPLQRTRPEFDIRRTILTIFRDRVLTKVLQNVNERIPALEPMLFTVLLETDNDESAEFSAIAHRVMGTKQVLLRSLVGVHAEIQTFPGSSDGNLSLW
ncbi:hypothetical protein Y032_0033g2785 [Ancylostoma ceylanicum]|nr:hypothetical protein Y032_0033g2785 [Ancylostoma ceylanicum]